MKKSNMSRFDNIKAVSQCALVTRQDIRIIISILLSNSYEV